uniref:Subtilisin n=1 Tax=Hydatigena taeniaeformis TaxID=6205 RepID=A0A0R3WYC1_HYDTA
LRSEAVEVARELAFSNSQVEAEWRRWRDTRVLETTESLTALTGAYVVYWNAVAEAWRDAAALLKAPVSSRQFSMEGSIMEASPQVASHYATSESAEDLWNVVGCNTDVKEGEIENKREQEWPHADLWESSLRSPSPSVKSGGVDVRNGEAVGEVLNCSQSNTSTDEAEGGREGRTAGNPSNCNSLENSAEGGVKERGWSDCGGAEDSGKQA